MNDEQALTVDKNDQKKISVEEATLLEQVLEAVRQIKFGFVQIIIQDGRVVQIDRTEKKRFDYK
jgi:hypothetical protein